LAGGGFHRDFFSGHIHCVETYGICQNLSLVLRPFWLAAGVAVLPQKTNGMFALALSGQGVFAPAKSAFPPAMAVRYQIGATRRNTDNLREGGGARSLARVNGVYGSRR
jgi:hypothetical protein